MSNRAYYVAVGVYVDAVDIDAACDKVDEALKAHGLEFELNDSWEEGV